MTRPMGPNKAHMQIWSLTVCPAEFLNLVFDMTQSYKEICAIEKGTFLIDNGKRK